MEHKNCFWDTKSIFECPRSFWFEIFYTVVGYVSDCSAYCQHRLTIPSTLEGWYAWDIQSFVSRQYFFEFDEGISYYVSSGARFNYMEWISANPTVSTNLISTDDTFKKKGAR